MIGVTVNGACGRMGRAVVSAIEGSFPNVKLVSLWERVGHPSIGVPCSGSSIPVSAQWDTDPGDVIIDFSTPEGLDSLLDGLEKHSSALVSGTTGLKPNTVQRLKKAAQFVPLLHASNMSVGIQVMHLLLREIAKALGPEWDVEMVEMHHRWKVDSPSGTALSLARTLEEAWPGGLEPVYGRKGTYGPRSKREMGIASVRGGDVVGEHEVIFAGPGEVLRLRHSALSRSAFAIGALQAAVWLAGRSPGFYTMEDVLRQRLVTK